MLLIRLDMVLYVTPFLLLYLIIAASYASPARRLRNAAMTLAVATPAAIALNAYQILPVVLGFGPKYLSSGQLFDVQEISVHTLNAYQSLLGFGREIGYLAFTGQQTWRSFPFLPLWAYYAAASLVIICAFLALARQRGRHTIFLTAMVVVAVFAAKGSNPPFGGLYAWAITHITIVSDIRDPNRWLVFEALGLAILAGIAVERLVTMTSTLLRRTGLPHRLGTLAGPVAGALVVAAMLVQVSPTLASGLKTWQPPGDELQLLSALRDDRSSGLAASIPYDQDTMFVDTSAYSGYEHDLGYESQLFSGVPVLGTGDWDQDTSNFVAYTSTLLGSGDPAFVSLLASLGVSHLISLNEPIIAAQLLEPGRGSFYQQAEAQAMPGLAPAMSTSGGTLYAVPSADPTITFRPNIAVVLGGRAGLAAFADLPGVDPSDWAVFDADDVLAEGGLPLLLNLISRSSLVLAGDAQPDEIAALAAPALAKLPGITSDPQLGRATLLLPSDQGSYDGALEDPSQAIPLPGTTDSSSSFILAATQTVEVWADMESSPAAADVTVTADGRTIYSQTPLAVGSGNFQWVLTGTLTLPAGRHEVTISTHASEFGDTYEVDETRVVASSVRASDQTQIENALAAASPHVAYSLDLDTAGTYADTTAALKPLTAVPGASAADFWVPTPGSSTVPDVTNTGAPAVAVDASGARGTYTIAAHSFPSPQDWSGRPYVFLSFDGTDSGLTYQVVVTFGNGAGDALYDVTDDQSGWRTIALSTNDPDQSQNVDWTNVTRIRLALPSKSATSTFALGPVSLSGELTSLPITYPAPYAAPDAPVTVASATETNLDCTADDPLADTAYVTDGLLRVDLPASYLGDGCRAVILPFAGIHALPVVLPATTTGSSYQATFTTGQPGVLVFDQAYDPGWLLSSNGDTESSIPTQSAVNGYLLPAGQHTMTLTYSGNLVGIIGLAVTLLVLAGVFLLMWRVRSPVRGVHLPSAARRASGWLRRVLIAIPLALTLGVLLVGLAQARSLPAELGIGALIIGSALYVVRGPWWVPWLVGLAVIAACPFVDLFGGASILDALGTIALALLALAITRLTYESIQSARRPRVRRP
jgi:hypothetical protein